MGSRGPKVDEWQKERIGEIRKNKTGSLMIIDKYNNRSDIWVKFLDNDYLVHATYGNFKNGSVRSPYDKTIYKVGYLGEGKYRATSNGDRTPQYRTWHSMIQRCYDTKFHIRQPTYRECSVYPEWHNFQTFAKWHDDNYYSIEEEVICLDKDIILKGNTVYSPEKCIFVPLFINQLFTKRQNKRGDLPIGVYFNDKVGKYVAHCNNGKGKYVTLNYHTNEMEAFKEYKTYKERLIKQKAEEYRSKIPKKLYNALMLYQVEIDD